MNQVRAAVSSLESQRKGALETVQYQLLLPLLPCLQVSWGLSECKRCMPVGEEDWERRGTGLLLGGRELTGSFVLRVLKVGFRRGLRRGSQWKVHQLYAADVPK